MFVYSAQIVATFFVPVSGFLRSKDTMLTADGLIYVPGYQKIELRGISLTPKPKSNHGKGLGL